MRNDVPKEKELVAQIGTKNIPCHIAIIMDGNGRWAKMRNLPRTEGHKRGKDSNRKTRLPFSPDHSLFAYLQFEDEFLKKEIGVKVRLETNLLPERFMDEYGQDREPGVAVLNGKIAFRFLDFHFQYMVRNITDKVYRSMGDYDMPGRTFWWGIYWEFFD